MAHEETFFVVIGVDEPAGDAIRIATMHFAGIGVKNINSLCSYDEPFFSHFLRNRSLSPLCPLFNLCPFRGKPVFLFPAFRFFRNSHFHIAAF